MSRVVAKHVADYQSRDKAVPSYWKNDDGTWYLHLPDDREDSEFDGLTANLANHTVVEHAGYSGTIYDDSISVSPSIRVSQLLGDKKIERHGYLTRGVWSEC